MSDHTYTTRLDWSGSTGAGYRAYDRAHTVTPGAAPTLTLSADPAFRGDVALPNPEQLLLAAASSCQLLSFLAVAALAHVDVIRYTDSARAVMPADASPMRIMAIGLDIRVVVRGTDAARVHELIRKAHEDCYVANTLSAPVSIQAWVEVAS